MKVTTPSSGNEAVYQLDRLSRRFGKGSVEVTAVRDTNLTIESGDYVIIAGPSGSGKTTLLQLLGGLDRPTSGSIRFLGQDMMKMKDSDLTKLRLNSIGFIFQQFNLIPTLTARQNVEVAIAPQESGSQAHDRAVELLRHVGLESRAGHLPTQLSGGEQQRVAIARALANRPKVLLADEPTGNLDSDTGRDVMSLLRSISNVQGQTLIVITHDPRIAGSAARLFTMSDGTVVEADVSQRLKLEVEVGLKS